MEITSRNNPIIINLKNMVKEKSLIVIDTPKLIKEAIQNNVKLYQILANEKHASQYENTIIVSNSIIEMFCDVESPAGIVAFIKHDKVMPQEPKGKFLVLDCVQDPGNIGTIIRSAKGADFKQIYLVDCAGIANSKVIRSSMGGIFSVECYEMTKNEFVLFQKEFDLFLINADMNGENIYSYKFPDKPYGIVLGNEGNGVSDEIKSICSSSIKIPMANNLESLNVAVSGSIIMFEITYGGK